MNGLERRARIMAILQLADGKLQAISKECQGEAERIAKRYREVNSMGFVGRLKRTPELYRETEAFYTSYPKPVAARPNK